MSTPRGTAAIVMAAGLGTRMRSGRAKVLHEVGGRPLVNWIVRAARPLAERVIVIVGHEREQVTRALGSEGPLGDDLRTVVQERQWGTGDAVATAAGELDGIETVLVLNGDVPRIRTETLERLLALHAEERAVATVLTFRAADPTGYGRIVRVAGGSVSAIVEEADVTDEQRGIDEVNSGMYAFDVEAVFPLVRTLPPSEGGEMRITDVIAPLVRAGRTVAGSEAPESEVMGINTQAQLAAAEAAFHGEKVATLHDGGVTIVDPESVRIDADVEVGPGTVLEPFVSLEGRTRIGRDCRVGTFVRAADTVVGDRSVVRGPLALVNEQLGIGSVAGPP